MSKIKVALLRRGKIFNDTFTIPQNGRLHYFSATQLPEPQISQVHVLRTT